MNSTQRNLLLATVFTVASALIMMWTAWMVTELPKLRQKQCLEAAERYRLEHPQFAGTVICSWPPLHPAMVL